MNTRVVSSGPAMERSTETLTRLSNAALVGVPLKTSPLLPGDPRFGRSAGGVVGVLRRCLDHQVFHPDEPSEVAGVDDDAALQNAETQVSGWSDQPRCVRSGSTECMVASSEALPTMGWGAPLALISISW